jgi:hypothetical protein
MFFKTHHKSLIDHVVFETGDATTKMKIENSKENTSDYLALIIEIKIDTNSSIQVKPEVEEDSERNTININWKNERSVENFENILKDKLRNIK